LINWWEDIYKKKKLKSEIYKETLGGKIISLDCFAIQTFALSFSIKYSFFLASFQLCNCTGEVC